MAYLVKEIYATLQGEGANSGRSAIFCRFAGCNLWSGREQDRASAICRFCDTEFRGTDGPGGGRFTDAKCLAEAIGHKWFASESAPFVVFTGGEPALQLDDKLLTELHYGGATLAVETNGTLTLPAALDWICVSPKAGTNLAVTTGDELKLIYPQEGIDPADFVELDFSLFFLQPMDGPELSDNIRACFEYCRRDPRWRLSVQTHKLIGIP